MESLFLLIPIGIVFVVVAVWIFIWAINSGQYDNLDTEAHRILFDEDDAKKAVTSKSKAEPALAQPTTKSDNDSDQNQGAASSKSSEEPGA